MTVHFSNSFKNSGTSLHLAVLDFFCCINPSDQELWDYIHKVCSQMQNSIKLDEVNKIANIAAAREGYKKCGKDPNRYRPSADSLIRRIVKGNTLYKVNNVVDILNLISIKTGISIGGYDLNKINGDVFIDIGKEKEPYIGIGRGELKIEGLPVLRDNFGSFGSPTSDSERTMIENSSIHISFVFFNFLPDEKIHEILKETRELLEKFVDGRNFKQNIIIQQ